MSQGEERYQERNSHLLLTVPHPGASWEGHSQQFRGSRRRRWGWGWLSLWGWLNISLLWICLHSLLWICLHREASWAGSIPHVTGLAFCSDLSRSRNLMFIPGAICPVLWTNLWLDYRPDFWFYLWSFPLAITLFLHPQSVPSQAFTSCPGLWLFPKYMRYQAALWSHYLMLCLRWRVLNLLSMLPMAPCHKVYIWMGSAYKTSE